MTRKLAIKNATIVNRSRSFLATVFISDDTIERIERGATVDATGYQEIDASGLHLFPGIIDTHVHFRDPGLTYKGDMETETRAAVAGGVTTTVDMPNTIPQTTDIQSFNNKLQHAEATSLTNFSFYLGATNANIEELLAADPKKVFALKVFMGSSTGNMLVDKEDTLDTIFKNSKLPIVAHCEDEAIIKANIKKTEQQYGNNPPFSVHPLIRNTEACFASSKKAVDLAVKYDARLHIAHLSTEKELSLLRNDIPLKDKKITAEICPHHLWFFDEDYALQGARIKCNPAIKTKNDREALKKGLRDNLLDTIATDHAPHTLEEKSKNYFETPGGIPSIQHSLQIMLELVYQNVISIETLVEKMCHNPALLFDIEKRGFIDEGFFADLVLVDLKKTEKIRPENILYKCKWSPFENFTFHSKILRTFVNGNSVWNNGKIDHLKNGKQLTFNR